MLDPWIIEEIKRREEEERDRRQPAVVELPLHAPDGNKRDDAGPGKKQPGEDDPPRGVVIIDYSLGG
jgi:hypothetical protein